jgi:hypothetical protein
MRVNLDTNPVIGHEWKKDSESAYDKWNLYMVICDTDIPVEQELPPLWSTWDHPPSFLLGFVLIDL